MTGGLHATGLFDADGKPLCVREDVGRHNAFDKVIGRAFLAGLLPLSRLACSASAAGSRSSSCRKRPSRAVHCSSRSARLRASRSSWHADAGITLCGFVRGGELNVYTEQWRIAGVTGVLLVGGASARFGSPKALARFGDETLADRAWRTLGEAFPASARGR